MTPIDGTIEHAEDIERRRESLRSALERVSMLSRSADATADDAREKFYEAIDASHGNPKDGKLTYEEIAASTGWSKGWVRLALKNYRDRKANT